MKDISNIFKVSFFELFDYPNIAIESLEELEIVDEGYYPFFSKGDRIFYTDKKNPSNFVNNRCVIGIDDGRILVGILRSGKKIGNWTIQNLNTLIPDLPEVKVTWAAKISLIKPL